MSCPIQENVDFVPLVWIVSNEWVDYFIHSDLIAKAQSEKNWWLKSTASSSALFKQRSAFAFEVLRFCFLFLPRKIAMVCYATSTVKLCLGPGRMRAYLLKLSSAWCGSCARWCTSWWSPRISLPTYWWKFAYSRESEITWLSFAVRSRFAPEL